MTADEVDAIIERLQAENAALAKLEQENERLRDALQRCCEEFEQWHDAKHVLAIARDALNREPKT